MHKGNLLGVFCIMAVMGMNTTFAALSPSGVYSEGRYNTLDLYP